MTTVKDLVAKLQKCPQDMKIVISHDLKSGGSIGLDPFPVFFNIDENGFISKSGNNDIVLLDYLRAFDERDYFKK